GSALLTGDFERAGEKRLVERSGRNLQADILIAPHHGSNTSSSPPLLEKVKPRYVLIPVGYLNRYHLPHPEALRRYRQIQARVFDTAHCGAIGVEPGSFAPLGYRQAEGRYWNAKTEPCPIP
ncbi:MAG: DNA internalization-related competence protein ComEC/Rec2, partial [Methylococcaceae bacterium]|nr:DNA internalization-related competence protein ComEC/Rec2 [Methylococcaceae bacterium]